MSPRCRSGHGLGVSPALLPCADPCEPSPETNARLFGSLVDTGRPSLAGGGAGAKWQARRRSGPPAPGRRRNPYPRSSSHRHHGVLVPSRSLSLSLPSPLSLTHANTLCIVVSVVLRVSCWVGVGQWGGRAGGWLAAMQRPRPGAEVRRGARPPQQLPASGGVGPALPHVSAGAGHHLDGAVVPHAGENGGPGDGSGADDAVTYTKIE